MMATTRTPRWGTARRHIRRPVDHAAPALSLGVLETIAEVAARAAVQAVMAAQASASEKFSQALAAPTGSAPEKFSQALRLSRTQQRILEALADGPRAKKMLALKFGRGFFDRRGKGGVQELIRRGLVVERDGVLSGV